MRDKWNTTLLLGPKPETLFHDDKTMSQVSSFQAFKKMNIFVERCSELLPASPSFRRRISEMKKTTEAK